ncbi:MAG: UDP-N-acetylmuramoyl-tripeptide--D-alanyl-D-alanine ligase [Deltaproteobacteria bacterium]|nr:UDP-N-acetylmuramoyl-tripeptide--D-alanyl-D-alanine ligase [Deltaproteobacteria bacterium]
MFTTEEILKATKAKLVGGDRDALKTSLPFKGVSQNSKTIHSGELFIAIVGQRLDGHEFLKEAFDRGVRGALVQKGCYSPKEFPEAMFFEVLDTTKALGDLAHFHRQKFKIPLVGITGSNGKTTTKDLLAHLLKTKMNVLKTEGNLNNLIGLPFTLFRLNSSHEIALLEMGMSFPFEIERLSQIAQPTAGLITNIGKAHLATMESMGKIAKSKGALFKSLSSKNIAFINKDDPYLNPFCKKVKSQVRTYSLKTKADAKVSVRGTILEDLGLKGVVMKCEWSLPQKEVIKFHLPLNGQHHAQNALAAVCVASYFGVPAQKIKSAIESFIPTEGRSHILHLSYGIILIDDSYNANPDSMAAGLKMLKNISKNQKTYAVLGDMLELGSKEKQYHAEIGRIIKKIGIDNVLTFGSLSQYIVKEADKNKKIRTFWTLNQDELISQLKQYLKLSPGVILVKGSHSMKMEKVVEALKTTFGAGVPMEGQT